jgi:hypothetical protein
MHLPGWVIVAAAFVAAIPFGWLLGVAVAELIVGRDFGVFPVLTIPLGWAAAVCFALTSRVRAGVRLAVLAGGTALFFVFV